MSVLVTGGAGFIGSSLCECLLEKGHRVVCIDNYYLGKFENIAHLFEDKDFILHEIDLCDLEQLSSIFAKERFEHVYHLAANSDISVADPMTEYRNTYTTTFNLLECMRLHGVKRLFFSSTGAVSGDADGEPVDESVPIQPISYYGAAKAGAEAVIHAYSFMNGFHSVIFRFPNVIGPRLTHGVIFDFINKLLGDSSRLLILGNGHQEKPYLHVSDLIRGIYTFQDGPQGVSLYNIGPNTTTSVKKIAEILCYKMGLTDVILEYTGGEGGWKGDVPRFKYSLDKIFSQGWRPTLSSDEAVEKTIDEALKERGFNR